MQMQTQTQLNNHLNNNEFNPKRKKLPQIIPDLIPSKKKTNDDSFNQKIKITLKPADLWMIKKIRKKGKYRQRQQSNILFRFYLGGAYICIIQQERISRDHFICMHQINRS